MPTYSFRHLEPIEDIIKSKGKFGPDLSLQATCVFEAISVFGSVEWPIFMRANPAQATIQLENNPFYTDFSCVWSLEHPDDSEELGSVAAIIVTRQACYAILRVKYGQSIDKYIDAVERDEGVNYWFNHFWSTDGLDRFKLLDDVELWRREGGIS